MKITTLALAAVLAAAMSGCSKDKKVAKPTPEPTQAAPRRSPLTDKPLEQLPADQQVSQTLALSGDIVKLCGIKVDRDREPDVRLRQGRAVARGSRGPRSARDVPDDRRAQGQGRSRSIGRADPRGTEEYNLGLGSRRAGSVGTYLARLGVGAAAARGHHARCARCDRHGRGGLAEGSPRRHPAQAGSTVSRQSQDRRDARTSKRRRASRRDRCRANGRGMCSRARRRRPSRCSRTGYTACAAWDVASHAARRPLA